MRQYQGKKKLQALVYCVATFVVTLLVGVPVISRADGYIDLGQSASGRLSNFYCALTGCTMTGQTVYSNVATDITTGTNEDLTLAPNGTGKVQIPNTLSHTATTAMTCPNSGGLITTATACFNGVAAWTSAATETVYIWGTTGATQLAIRTADATSDAIISLFDSAGTNQAQLGWANASFPTAALQSSMFLLNILANSPIILSQYNNSAAGTDIVQVYNNIGTTPAKVVNIDGAGNIKVASTATRFHGTCTLNAASPSVCTATVVAGSICTCSPVGTTAAIAAGGCAVSLASTTLTVTGPNAAGNVVNYRCD